MKNTKRFLASILVAIITLSTSTTAVSASYNSTSTSSAYVLSSTSNVPAVNITKDSFINYTYGEKNFGSSNNIWLYDFCTDMYTGIGNGMTESVPGEMYLGIHAYVKDDRLNFKYYQYATDPFTIKGVYLKSNNKKIELNIKNPKSYTKLDTSMYPNGLYKIEMPTYDEKRNRNVTVSMFFYVNNGKTYLCSYTLMREESIKPLIERRKTIEKMLNENGITPENSTDTSNLCFPWHPSIGRNDIPNWIALADEIVKDEWSEGKKAFAIYEWMVKNLAYDYYKSDTLKMRRARYHNDYSGSVDTFDTKVGVCFDFSNAYAAMCRSQGIPAITIDCDKHTWNMIYINGKWIEVDITNDVRGAVYEENMTKIYRSNSHYYQGYGTLKVNNSIPTYVNYWLMTFEKAEKRGYC